MKHKYEVIIYWSEEDKVFIAEVPELPGCVAHGKTHKEALKQINVAIELWVETAKERGEYLPTPKGRRLMVA